MTKLRDAYVFLLEKERVFNKKYDTKEEAQQVLEGLQAAQPLLFADIKIRCITEKKIKKFMID